ncbi:MAG: EamA family transporter [Bacillota bacterium]|nr:EamA family transporter [Bacillota bacterium]
MEITHSSENSAKIKLISAMIAFGTIGIFVRYIPLSSTMIALIRGIVGTVFLIFITLLQKTRISASAIKKNLPALCLSGAFIGINWILLFEAYRYTTVAAATLCYYLAPIFVIVASPFFLKETLTLKKILCVLGALIGMVLISGVVQNKGIHLSEMKGIFFGTGAALFYASVILLNKKIKDISAYDKTIMQLASASVVLLPYALLTENFEAISLTPSAVILLLVVGILHTGICYTLYFGSMRYLKAQTVAIFSYIDPVVAIILSAVILHEKMDLLSILGAVMILGSTLISELQLSRK